MKIPDGDLHAALPAAALIAGCGDVGLRVAARLRALGREVTAIVRDRQKIAALNEAGVIARIEDLDQPQDAGDWPLLFWFAPPSVSSLADVRLRGRSEEHTSELQSLMRISNAV